MLLREIPPTAGLPMRWQDIFTSTSAESFESNLAQFLGALWVKVTCSGTAALVIALEYLKSRSNRTTVVVPGYTCPLVAIAIHQSGLKVRVCDTLEDSFDFDPALLSGAVTSDTLAVIPTHIGGLSADMDSVVKIAHAAGAFVIEDAAQALGATNNNRRLGTIGDIGILSLSLGKGLTIYQGGALVARDNEIRKGLAETANKLVKPDAMIELTRSIQLLFYGLLYNPCGLSLAYGAPLRYWLDRQDEQRAVGDIFPLSTELAEVGSFRRKLGNAALTRLPAFLTNNQKRGKQRAEQLNAIGGLTVHTDSQNSQGSWPFLTVTFRRQSDCDRALIRLWDKGVGVTKLFVHALTGYEYLSPILGEQCDIPNAESLANRTLTISNTNWLSEKEFQSIEETLKSCIAPTSFSGAVTATGRSR